MICHTTCFYTADGHWMRVDELAQHPYVPLLVWRAGAFRYTTKPYEVYVEEVQRIFYRIETVYQISLCLSCQQKVPTERGLVSAYQLTPDDEMYMYLRGKLIKTRPHHLTRLCRRKSYRMFLKKDGFAAIARDVCSRWNMAFDVGILISDSRGSGDKCNRVIPRFLPPAISRRKKAWTPPSRDTEISGSDSDSSAMPTTSTPPITPTPSPQS